MAHGLDRNYWLTPRNIRPTTQYAFALLATLCATGPALFLPYSRTNPVFAFFFLAVWAAAWIGGARVGLFACALSFFEALYVLLPPRYSFALKSHDQAFRLLIQVLVSAVGVLIVAKLRTAVLQRSELLAQKEASVAAQRESEEERLRLNRTLKALSNCNGALLHASDEAALLEEICRIVTEDCGHAMVWIGYAEHDEEKTVRPVAYAGFEEGYLETLRITWADNERGRGPTGTAIRTGQACSCRNMLTDPQFAPWRAQAIRRGYASSLVLPLIVESTPFGAITIYSRAPDPFAEDEVKLLEELAGNLAYGIFALRAKAAREKAEQDLRQHQEWLRITLASIGDAVMATDTAARVTFLNPVAATLTGWSNEEARGHSAQTVFRIINEQTRAAAEDIVGRVLKEGCTVELANHTALVAKDGREIPIEDSAAPIRADDGRVIGTVLVFHDVTEKRRAEEALRLSEEKFAKIFAGNPAAIVLTRLNDGLFVDVNDTWIALLGYSREEAIGHSAREMNIWPDSDAAARFVEELQQQGFLRGWEQEFKKKSGEVFIAEMSAQILIVRGEKLVLTTFVDITTRKKSEQALIQSEKLASIGRLASTIAHEINNPLETVGHAIYLASTDPGTSEKAKSYLDLAEQQMQRIAHITKQTLAFHREGVTSELIDLGDNLEGVLRFFAQRMQSRGISIEKRYAKGDRIVASDGEVQQIVSNLLTNSMDALPKGGKLYLRISPTIGLNSSRALRLTIADTGSGIPPRYQKKIFEPFCTTKEVVGTGLGLWVTKQIVDKHGWTIRFRSKLGKGTAFSIVFPAASADSQVN